jgi:hypothetical protein
LWFVSGAGGCPLISSLSWLARLAVLAWLAWLGLVGLMLGMLWLRVWHPHYLPFAAALVLLPVASIALLFAGVWRVIRGPERVGALCCLLLGLAPLGFLTGHFMYGFRLGFGRQLDLNLPLKALIPLGDSILDLIAGFSYPKRTVGERVVMISAPLPEQTARQQVAMMDRHVRELQSRLGRTSKRRVYWVRGPVMGLQGKAIDSLCLGSRQDEHPPDFEGLTTLDRHEVGHVVLSQFCAMGIEPPAVLVEGWAEANSGISPNALILRAAAEHGAGRTYSLRTLLGADWYGRHDLPVYVQGALLVDYILREFGPDRFLSLYATCSQATFDEDCRRILGVTVDELDKGYWAPVEKIAGHSGYARRWLSSLELDSGVDRADWEGFISDYFKATERALAPYEHVRLTAEKSYTNTGPDGKTSNTTWRYELKRSGPLRVLRAVFQDREEVYLAHPEHSFRAERKARGDAWEIREHPRLTREQLYRWIIQEIDRTEPVTGASAPLIALADSFTSVVNPLCMKVANFSRFSENGRRFVRVELDDCPPGHPAFRKISQVLSADDYSPAHEEYVIKTGKTLRVDAIDVFEADAGIPVLVSARGEGHFEDGGTTKSTLTVTDRHFGPISEDEFTPERVLEGAPVHHITDRPGPSELPEFLNWYPLPIVLGGVFLVAGAGLFGWLRGFSRVVG